MATNGTGLLHTVSERAALTLRLCGLLLISSLLPSLWPGYVGAVALFPCEASLLLRLARTVSYPLAIPSPLDWLPVAFSLILSGLVAERQLGWKGLLGIWSCACTLGGLLYLLLEESCVPFGGPAAFAWGYAGACLYLVPAGWGRANVVEKAYFYLIVLACFSLLAMSLSSAALQGVGALVGMAAAYATRGRGSIAPPRDAAAA